MGAEAIVQIKARLLTDAKGSEARVQINAGGIY